MKILASVFSIRFDGQINTQMLQLCRIVIPESKLEMQVVGMLLVV